MSEKLNALIEVAKGEVAEILVDEALPVLVGEMLRGTVLEAATEAAGVVMPGVGHIMLSYKQKKLEKNFELYISKIIEYQDEINRRLGMLEEAQRFVIKTEYFGLIADYASQTKQEEKIDLIVNGFINIAGNVLPQKDSILMYYDTLDQLTMLDLRVLRVYIHSSHLEDEGGETISDIMKAYDLDFSQMEMIKEKLARLGLLESKNDVDMDENIRNMAQYLEEVSKGKKNPKLKHLKRISKSESYRLTPYGRKLHSFFAEVIHKEE